MLFIFKKSHNDIRYFRIFNDCILIIHELIVRCCLFILKSHDDVCLWLGPLIIHDRWLGAT